MHVQKVHYSKVVLVLAATSGIIVLMAKMKPVNDIVADTHSFSKNDAEKEIMDDISKMRSMDDALSISQFHSCPVCLGRDLCPDFSQGFLTMSIFGSSGVDGLEYQGFLREEDRLLVRSPAGAKWRAWDARICANSSQWEGCLVGQVAKESFLSWSHADAKTLRSLIDPPAPLTVCSNRNLATVLQTTFDDNNDGIVSMEERAMMLSSLAVAPGIAGLRLATKLNLGNLPTYIGSCGRLAVIQGNLTPLKEYLSSSWETRTNLAAQLLTMVESFISGDASWMMVVWGMGWRDLAVTKAGQLVLTHMDQVTLVDREMIKAAGEEERPRCNVECFDQFKNRVFKSTPRGQPSPGCGEILEFADMMYANICRDILGTGSGLLHSPPHDHKELLGQMVGECDEEDYPGSRWQVVSEIMDYLTGEENDEDEEDDQKDDEVEEGDDANEEEDEEGGGEVARSIAYVVDKKEEPDFSDNAIEDNSKENDASYES